MKKKKEVKKKSKKTQPEKIKITYSKKALFWVIFLIAILIVLIVVLQNIITQNQKIGDLEKQCQANEDCVIQRITCCPCTSGGEEKCMTKQEAEQTQKRLDEECSKDLVCTALFNCKIENCKCDEEKCLESNETTQIPNPASAYCIEQGGVLEIRENKLGQYGVCIKDGKECEEWDFYKGECSLE